MKKIKLFNLTAIISVLILLTAGEIYGLTLIDYINFNESSKNAELIKSHQITFDKGKIIKGCAVINPKGICEGTFKLNGKKRYLIKVLTLGKYDKACDGKLVIETVPPGPGLTGTNFGGAIVSSMLDKAEKLAEITIKIKNTGDRKTALGMIQVNEMSLDDYRQYRYGNWKFKTVNPSAEIVFNGKPFGWTNYHAAGRSEWGTLKSSEAPEGDHFVFVKNIEFNSKSGSIYDAAVLGFSNGHIGALAYSAKPSTRYKVSFWVKSIPEEYLKKMIFVKFRTTKWETEMGYPRDRKFGNIKNLKIISKKGSWNQMEGSFTTLPTTKKFAVSFGIGGDKAHYHEMGELQVDDVKINPVFRVGVFRGGQTLAYQQIMHVVKKIPQVETSYFKEITAETVFSNDAIIFPDCKSFVYTPNWREILRKYVEVCGGSILFYHDSVGYSRSPFGQGEPIFPEIAKKPVVKESNWPDPYEVVVKDNDHFITCGWRKGEKLPLMYVDIIEITAGPNAKVLCESPKGLPALTVGELGRGRLAFNGTIIYNKAGNLFESAIEATEDFDAVGTDLALLANTVKWFMAKKEWLVPKESKKIMKEFIARAKTKTDKHSGPVILPKPQKVNIEKGEINISSGDKPEAVIVVGDNAEPRVFFGAESIVRKVECLGGRIEVKKASELTENDKINYNLIVLGGKNENSLSRELMNQNKSLFSGEYDVSPKNPGPEGYVIRCFKNKNNKDVILGVGSDVQGTMYAGHTIRWLLIRKNNRVIAVPCSIWDHPDIAVRCVKLQNGPRKIGQMDFDKFKKEVDWLARYKCNYVTFKCPFLMKMEPEKREKKIAEYIKIRDYLKSKGIKVSNMHWIAMLPRGTGHGTCMNGFCYSNPEFLELRKKELEMYRDILKPDMMWFHAHDGSAVKNQKIFDNRCEACKKQFKTRAQSDAAAMNFICKNLGNEIPTVICSTPYSIDPDGAVFEDERCYLKEMGRLTPETKYQCVRETANLKAYNRLTGKKMYVYQAHYYPFNSELYANPELVYGVMFINKHPLRAAGTCYLWETGFSGDMPTYELEKICQEIAGEKAGKQLAKVLVPNFRTCNDKFWTAESKLISKRTAFDPEDLEERIAEHKQALQALELAAKEFKPEKSLFPEYADNLINDFTNAVQKQLTWYEICQLKQNGKTGEYAKKLGEFKKYLQAEKPNYYKLFLSTIKKIDRK